MYKTVQLVSGHRYEFTTGSRKEPTNGNLKQNVEIVSFGYKIGIDPSRIIIFAIAAKYFAINIIIKMEI